MACIKSYILFLISVLLLCASCAASLHEKRGDDGGRASINGLATGERIAARAESFVGTPYDPDPQGLYVTTQRIVADESMDCMYHTFRSVELALSNTPEEAEDLALGLRFRTRGVLGPDGLVLNYEERYEYAMDMIRGGRWGMDVTGMLGDTVAIKGERGLESVDILPREALPEAMGKFRSGDVVYFIKPPSRRVVGEIVGHLGLLKKEEGGVYLIHASGLKNKGGQVKKVPFDDYVGGMKFIGIKVTRFR